MEEISFEIPHADHNIIDLETEPKIDKVIEAIKWMSEYLSKEKYISSQNSQFVQEISNVNSLLNNRLDFLIDEFKCKKCFNKQVEYVTHCGHGFCMSCLQEYIDNQTMSKIILNELESKNQIISASCPICQTTFSISDLEKIFPDLNKYIEASKKRYISLSLSLNSFFNCLNCKKTRGKALSIQGICIDYCLECIKIQILNEKIFHCKKCQADYNNDEVLCKKFKCEGCKMLMFYIGDNMQEICKNYILCASCAVIAIDKVKCPCLIHDLELEKKVEIANSLFRVCEMCENEFDLNKFEKKRCCLKWVCTNCYRNKKCCV
ncbi:hypothetical protein SteCoe_12225 [Stentor coeruleus]|uniref:RING-type domain-containing protein n=1 Tax=Stentor coeruleus TaxID=5963 RepID=A0A1R2CBD3_9CILI|nr:hypothetical protein SteCoe_12225 [Stentor coeruleus]